MVNYKLKLPEIEVDEELSMAANSLVLTSCSNSAICR